jgi:hypothetical protein
MNSRMLLPLLWIPVIACLTGCAVTAYITDIANVETQVKNVSVSGAKTLTVVNGESVKNIPLESCDEITVSSEESRTVAGRLFFLGTVVLRDGTKLDARNKNNEPLTYVLASDVISGESHKGRFSISFANVTKIRIVKN